MRAAVFVVTLVCAIAPGVSCRGRTGAGAPAGALPVVTTAGGVEMVRVPGGWFEMGSAAGGPEEGPVHRVWVDSFLMDRREVAQRQFRTLSLPDPSHFKGPDRPVEQITWADVVEFCNERSKAEGLRPCYSHQPGTSVWRCDFEADGYRLPTEAEWEYACRAGTRGERFLDGDERDLRLCAWYAANSAKATHPVGLKKPNAWGLFDMYGNVAEWCNDRYDPRYYASSPAMNPRGPAGPVRVVLRGGGWDSKPHWCRSAARAGENPRFQDVCFARDTIGFRCVRRVPAGR